uniref:Uncharacterized protein n=1 Tax=Meloidogyne incognita TaxID=6306 RepID=A0A914LNM5_MELIC
MPNFRMNSLQYQPHEEQQRSTNTEFLDEILLAIGLVGELIHSSTGVMCWISTQSDKAPIKMELLYSQSLYSCQGDCALCLPKPVEKNPENNLLHFLLISNVSLFFFHTLEGMKSVFGDTIATRRARPYAKLIVGVAPLVVFFRFHSSVCLAEIWKYSYNNKNNTFEDKNKFKYFSELKKNSNSDISDVNISIKSTSPSTSSSFSSSVLSSILN